jgi:putative redox protein
MVTIHSIYQGELRAQSTHGPSGTQLITDAPLDNQGKGESFSPTDLVGAALGSCMLTIMGIVAERHGWALLGARAEVQKHMLADPQRRISKLEVQLRIPGEWDDKAQQILKAAALGCPVFASLHADMDIPVSFEFGAAENA